MTQANNPLLHIKQLLENKSKAKQITYKNLLTAFQTLSSEAERVVSELKNQVKLEDEDVVINFQNTNEHEFQVKLAGDQLIFVLHTNIVTLDDALPLMQMPYFKENEINRYFGQIMIYNFMSDSIKYNRVNDPGYLLARVLLNHENRFLVEGELGSNVQSNFGSTHSTQRLKNAC